MCFTIHLVPTDFHTGLSVEAGIEYVFVGQARKTVCKVLQPWIALGFWVSTVVIVMLNYVCCLKTAAQFGSVVFLLLRVWVWLELCSLNGLWFAYVGADRMQLYNPFVVRFVFLPALWITCCALIVVSLCALFWDLCSVIFRGVFSFVNLMRFVCLCHYVLTWTGERQLMVTFLDCGLLGEPVFTLGRYFRVDDCWGMHLCTAIRSLFYLLAYERGCLVEYDLGICQLTCLRTCMIVHRYSCSRRLLGGLFRAGLCEWYSAGTVTVSLGFKFGCHEPLVSL
eukprot:gene3457-2408_t